MVKVVDFSSWEEYDGFSCGSGRSEKRWLVSKDGEIGLFKYPKEDPISKRTTFEHISEHLAYRLGKLVDVQTAKVDIGVYNDRIGSMSYLINEDTEELREGIWFISGRHPQYDPEKMLDIATNEHYALKHLFEIIDDIEGSLEEKKSVVKFWIKMLVFDNVIGNSDRHQSNWAYLVPVEDKEKRIIRLRPCPLYDNGSSLCCFVRDDQIQMYIGNDKNRFRSLVGSKSKSLFRINPHDDRRPMHLDIVRHLLKEYEITREIVEHFIKTLSHDAILDVIEDYPDQLVCLERKSLITRFLEEKINCLKVSIEEIDNE